MSINDAFFNYLKDKLLMRCFDRIEYRDSFVNGSCIHMNSTQLYRNIENCFQGDINDCAVFVDGTRFNGKVYVGNGKPEVQLGEAEISSFTLGGYLYCFFSLPKSFFAIQNGELLYDKESVYCMDFFKCLEEYKNNSATKKCYVVIMDAYNLVNRMNETLDRIPEVSYTCGFVDYIKMDTGERIEKIMNRDINRIVFTKDPPYKYQREFRYYVTSQNNKPYLEFAGKDMTDICFLTFEHNPYDLDVFEMIK